MDSSDNQGAPHGVHRWSETDRLRALERYAILDTGREAAFDDLAALAADLLDAPIAVVNFIAADRQWFKAEVGIGTDTLPLDVSICRHAILQTGILVVPDLTKDQRFGTNPLVNVADGLRFYAGALLETPDGLPLGTLCVLDSKVRPRGINDRQKRALKALAAQTMTQLELRRSEAIAREEGARAERHARRLSLVAEISAFLLAQKNAADTVGELFSLLSDEFHLDVGFHYRCSDDALRLEAALGLTEEQEAAATRIEFGQTICGIVAATRAAMHVRDIQSSDDPNVAFLKALGLDSYFSAPLLAVDELLGTISFGRRDGPFSPGEVEALSMIIAQLATAIDRGHVERTLRASERELRFALKAGRFGAWSLDLATGDLTTSETCRANFGRSPNDPFSYSALRDAVHPDDQQRMSTAVDESIATAADYDIEYRIRTPQGEVRWVLIRAQPSYGADGTPLTMTGVSIDITDRKRAEARRQASDMLGHLIRDTHDPDALAYAAAELLGRTLEVSRVGYATIVPDTEMLHVRSDWNAPGILSLAGVVPLRDYGSFIDSLKRGESVSIPDVRNDERTTTYAAALENRSARSFVNVPIVERGRLNAVLYVNHAETREWASEDLALIQEIAERTRNALERHRTDVALGESEMRYRTLFENIDAGFCTIDVLFDEAGRPADYRFVEVNPAFVAQTDLTDAVGRTMREFAPDMEQHWFDLYGGIALSGTPRRWENEAASLGRWYEVYAYRVGAPEQRRVAVLFNDVSERKRADERVKELNAILEQRVEERTAERNQMWTLSRDVMLRCGFDGRIFAVNPAWTETLGWREDELVGCSLFELVHPDDLRHTQEGAQAHAAGQSFERFENRYRHRDGSYRDISWSTRADADAIIAVGRDVTEDRAQAEALAMSMAERDRLWTLSEDMLARADYTGMMSAVSPAWTRVLGWSKAELLSRPYASFMHPDDMEPTLAAISKMSETGRPARFENRILSADGAYKPIEWTVAPEEDNANFIAVGRDLSAAKAREAELAMAQEALRQSQKMEAMGSLTGGVAHDFNNLLTPIVGSLDMLQRKGLGGEREQRLIAGAIQSADRAKTLVQRLLAFARRQPLQSTAVDLGPLVRGMADLVTSTTGPQIRVLVDAPDGLPLAKADPNQLEMAILNLAVNARDAMPDGGTLRISVNPETVGRQHRAGVDPGEYLRLLIADTGQGMDEVTLQRAVEPFFSTKGVGKGTGLGLSMVHGLASQLGGAMTISSTPGDGTNVELWLPQSAEPLASVDPVIDSPPHRTGRGTALLVDDEDVVRLSTADMLIELGYSVVEAASAEEALELIDRGLEPDILVTDHLMSGISGTELARIMQIRQPRLKVLVVSGYAEADGIAADLPRLTKPFRNAELAASLGQLS